MVVVRRIVPTIAVIRNADHAVGGLVTQECSLAFFEHADDLVVDAVDQDGLAHSFIGGKERLVNLVANHGHVGAMQVFELGEEAALGELGVLHLRERGSGAREVQVADFMRAVTCRRRKAARSAAVEAGIDLDGHGLNMGTLVEYGQRIFQSERLAGAFFGAQASYVDADIEAINEKCVQTVIVEKSGDVAADTHQDRGNKNHGAHANDHSEDGEERAHLVVGDRLQRHPRVFAKLQTHTRSYKPLARSRTRVLMDALDGSRLQRLVKKTGSYF